MPIPVVDLVHHTRLAGKFIFGTVGIVRSGAEASGRSGLVAFHILQSGVSCRLPKTPRSYARYILSVFILLTLLYPQRLEVSFTIISM